MDGKRNRIFLSSELNEERCLHKLHWEWCNVMGSSRSFCNIFQIININVEIKKENSSPLLSSLLHTQVQLQHSFESACSTGKGERAFKKSLHGPHNRNEFLSCNKHGCPQMTPGKKKTSKTWRWCGGGCLLVYLDQPWDSKGFISILSSCWRIEK